MKHGGPKSLKLSRRLAFKLMVWMGGCLLVLTGVSVYLGVRARERDSLDRIRQSGMWFSDTVKRALHHCMLKDQRDNVHAIIRAIGRQEGVEAIRIFNKKGRIVFSSRRPEIGKLVDMQAEACFGCHFKDRPLERLPRSGRSRVFRVPGQEGRPGHRVLGVITPIYTERACYTDPCHVHPPEQKVLGVLDVDLSLAAVDRRGRREAWRLAGLALVVVVVISGLLFVFIHFFVTRPLSSLVGATRAIARGHLDHPVEPATDDEIGVLAESFDIMRQRIKKRTEELQESRRLFQTLFEQVPCYISVQDRDFKVTAFNKMFERDFGDQTGNYCYAAYKNRTSKCPNCAVEKTFRDGRVHSAEETVYDREGQPIYFLNLTAPITDAEGNVTSVMEMATNITAIRRLEQQLRKSEEKYRLFFNNAPNPIFVFDRQSLEILDANDRALDQYGYSKAELAGMSFLDLTDPDDREQVRRFLTRGEGFLARVHQLRKDGEGFYVNLRASYGEHMGRRAVIATTADITRSLETEQQLIQAAKMATLGEMSAGVAHELNQPLSVIATAANILRNQSGRDAPPNLGVLREVAREIAAQVERATRIINHLREFGRKAEVHLSRVRLNQPIQGALGLLRQQLRVHDIELMLELDPELPPIWGNANRLEQVIINLVLNARDAIEERRQREGKLPGRIVLRTFAQGGQVVMTVEDNGTGIPPGQRDRIFEPFYTTKEVGKGTGLGLSISYGIVRDYQGNIQVDDSPLGGARFRLSFPRAGEEETV